VTTALTTNATPGKILNAAGSPNLILYTGFIPANQAPVADFTWTCTPKQLCTLDATLSHDSDGSITSYTWLIERIKKPLTGAIVTVDLKGNKARAVSLTVADNTGANGSVTKSVVP
jgi:hypothetical protein